MCGRRVKRSTEVNKYKGKYEKKRKISRIIITKERNRNRKRYITLRENKEKKVEGRRSGGVKRTDNGIKTPYEK